MVHHTSVHEILIPFMIKSCSTYIDGIDAREDVIHLDGVMDDFLFVVHVFIVIVELHFQVLQLSQIVDVEVECYLYGDRGDFLRSLQVIECLTTGQCEEDANH